MNKIQPVLALLLVVAVQGFCCQTPPPPPATEIVVTGPPFPENTESPADTDEPSEPQDGNPGSNNSIGTISQTYSRVQSGPPESLEDGSRDFNNGETVRVTDGGKGKLSLNDGTELILFNQTEVSGVTTSTSPPETDLFLQSQGFLGYVPPGGNTTVSMPNGAEITILGTNFLILYDENSQTATAGNFDGTVHFIPPGGSEQNLETGYLVEIFENGSVSEPQQLPFTPDQFEQTADNSDSPSVALSTLATNYAMLPLNVPIIPLAPLLQVPIWHEDKKISFQIFDKPNVASPAQGQLDLFVWGTDNALWRCRLDGSVCNNWESLGGVLTSSPSAIWRGENRVDIFALSTDKYVWQQWWNGEWQGWYSLGGVTGIDYEEMLIDSPSVSSWGPDRLDVFVKDIYGGLQQKYWNTSWSGWVNLGGDVRSSPSAVSWGSNRIDIVARGPQDQVMHLAWNGEGWYWDDLGGQIQGSPAISSWGSNRLDVFVRGLDGNLYQKYYDGREWSDWTDLGYKIYSSPTAVSWGPERIDVFATGEYGQLLHYWYGK